MRNFLLKKNIIGKFYILKHIFWALILVSYFNIGLYYLSRNLGWKVFPENRNEELLLFVFESATFLAWLLGERTKTLLIFAYVFTFLILGFAYFERDIYMVARLLTPTFLAVLTFFLYKSPTEFLIEKREKKYNRILEQLRNLQNQISFYKARLKELQKELENVNIEKRKLEEKYSQNRLEELEELIKHQEELKREYETKIGELKKKLETLQKNNRELWQLLEELSQEEPKNPKEEVRKLRKERKKLTKELLALQSEIKELREENELLKVEMERIERERDSLKEKLNKLETELSNLQKENEKLGKILEKSVLNLLNRFFERVEFSTEAVKDFENLPEKDKLQVISLLRKLEKIGPENYKGEKTEVGGVFKERFSGGRIYFSVENGKFVIKGILKGEDSKSKATFIRKRFS
jgi:mRNA-degrading endonuclease RelE of RelBE toxin-antitoxin system/prefoldin subunit 5